MKHAPEWDDPRAAEFYEEFCRRHSRYAEANRALINAAALTPGLRVLDVGAGTGRTAEAALPHMRNGDILCFEPAAEMRRVGQTRLKDARVSWAAGLPSGEAAFDRILCGAAIWLLTPLDQNILNLALLLRAGGALCFNIPSLYLGEPDQPGGGADPLLLRLPELIAAGRRSTASPVEPLPDAPGIDRILQAAGLRATRWRFRTRLTQAAYRDWLKIPIMTGALLQELSPDDRAVLIDRAYNQTDATSWRWERWTGWTAWRER